MIQEYANRLVDCDPMTVARRTLDTRRYIHMIWNRSHAEPIDDDQLNLFLCDEHYGNLTDEQKAVARQGRDEMRDVYGAALYRMMLCEEILRRNMVADANAYHSVFYPEGTMEGGAAPWMLDRAG
ncbi:hypothetical protein [Yanshouia hominis]|uniref:Uncharacterized protein n=1 Tax=Yanshouia hominis TaxID=2763673 RepID=A0ABR7NM67_9FIRM|nr:hypothetical protein [Yanshouia hominis]MBC8577409.1 hypothetical protein [Yanshouia hominis]